MFVNYANLKSKIIGTSVQKPYSGTLSGHAAGEPFMNFTYKGFVISTMLDLDNEMCVTHFKKSVPHDKNLVWSPSPESHTVSFHLFSTYDLDDIVYRIKNVINEHIKKEEKCGTD